MGYWATSKQCEVSRDCCWLGINELESKVEFELHLLCLVSTVDLSKIFLTAAAFSFPLTKAGKKIEKTPL